MRKDKVRFGTIVGILLFVGFLVVGFFFLDYQIEENFTGKIEQDSQSITRDDLRFVDVFYEIYSFPGCKEVDRDYKGDVSIAYYVDYDDYKCEFYVDGIKVKIEDEHYIKNLDIFKEHNIKITCSDYSGNKVSKSKTLKNYC